MFDVIRSYISKEDFYIIVLKNNLYIKNYSKLLSITDDEILVEIASKLYKISGIDFSLTKTIGKELLIKGSVERIVKV